MFHAQAGIHDIPDRLSTELGCGGKMSLICVVCGHIIVMSDNPDHYAVCHKCGPTDLTKEQQEKIERGFNQ